VNIFRVGEGMEKTLSSRLLHEGKSFSFKTDQVELPNGRMTTRDIVDHPGAVAIVPVLDGSRIVMVKQFRYAVGKELFEIPAGTLERGEEPDACAARELREETGYKAKSIVRLLSCYMAPGYSNEVIHLYVATGLEKGEKETEEDEEIAVEAVGFDETLKMIEENEIEDAKTIVGVLSYLTRGGNP
jgi:ADP-ribose pyrophosphatase